MNPTLLSPRTIQIANELLDWAKTYLMAENPEIKRPTRGNQSVCPYVGASIENDSFYMAFHPEINGRRAEPIEEVMLDYIPIFRNKVQPFGPSERMRKALLVVFPEIPEKSTYVLDTVFANIKDRFVAEGLMVGQFHKNCDQRGVYNHRFKVSLSPYPLFALRHMSLHDIIFLHDHEHWFLEYNNRFGERFKPENLDDDSKPLIENYRKAKERFLD